MVFGVLNAVIFSAIFGHVSFLSATKTDDQSQWWFEAKLLTVDSHSSLFSMESSLIFVLLLC